MSDDLISRKALLENLMEEIPLAENVHIFKDIIKNQPTAFDKEKVKIQIKNKVGIGMCQEENCKKYNNDCELCRVETAITIVEKGGVE